MDGIGPTIRTLTAGRDTAGAGTRTELMAERQRSFAGVLARVGEAPRSAAGSDADARAREAAQDFVAIALVQPLLAQLRAGNRAAPPFAPGPAEKQFGAIADAETARRIVRSSGFALVDRLAHDLARAGGEA